MNINDSDRECTAASEIPHPGEVCQEVLLGCPEREKAVRQGFPSPPWQKTMHFVGNPKVLVPGGRAFVVIGDGQHPSGVIPVLPLMEEAAKRSGLDWLGDASQDRRTWTVGGRSQKETRREYIVALNYSAPDGLQT